MILSVLNVVRLKVSSPCCVALSLCIADLCWPRGLYNHMKEKPGDSYKTGKNIPIYIVLTMISMPVHGVLQGL